MSIWMKGMKAVCIDDSRAPEEPGQYVSNGSVYTVQSVQYESICGCEFETLVFEELVAIPHPDWTTGYVSDCFRPATTVDEQLAMIESEPIEEPELQEA